MVLETEFKNWLAQRFADKAKFDEPLSGHCSFHIGGPADVLIFPESIDAVKEIIAGCFRKGLPYYLIGDGTNLLFSDAGFRGVVICLKQLKEGLRIERAFPDSAWISAPAGVRTAKVCRWSTKQGLDANFALGIPGTIGGAISMNAGTRLGCFADHVAALTVLLPNGDIRQVERERLVFAYRQLKMDIDVPQPGPPVILEIVLRLEKGDPLKIAAASKTILQQRKTSQPLGDWSAGCFFKNPGSETPAGRLIDQAGLRGYRLGSAQISEKHANFIVNTGKATAREVLGLMRLAQEEVLKKFNIQLEPEVKIVHE